MSTRPSKSFSWLYPFVLSLLGGCLLLFVIFIFWLPGAKFPGTASVAWSGSDLEVATGAGQIDGDTLRLTLDDAGRAVVLLPVELLSLNSYPYIRLDLSSPFSAQPMVLFWETSQFGKRIFRKQRSAHQESTIWFRPDPAEGWTGQAKVLGLALFGQAGETVQLNAVVALPGSRVNLLAEMASDWLSVTGWQATSINFYRGTRSPFPRYFPVPVVALFLLCSLFSYAAIFILYRRQKFQWNVVYALFLACWLALDLLWLGKQLGNVADTAHRFADLSPEQKQSAASDADLQQFVADVKVHIGEEDAPVFLGAGRDTRAPRAAYYLAPHPVFLQAAGPELPAEKHIHPGDFLVLLKSEEVHFNPKSRTLFWPPSESLEVAVLLDGPVGSLYRVVQ